MQRLGGLLLMLAGATLGAYTFLPPTIDGRQALREVTRISAAPDRSYGRDDAVVTVDAERHVAMVSKSEPVVEAAPAASTLAISRPASSWSAIVTAETRAQGRMTSLTPGDSGARLKLTRDLQAELKRVGCYAGEITGSWSPATKSAMNAFMDRVNATLPIEEPDYILLTLVQGHAEIACGASCPFGQSMSGNGRCVPNAVLARDARKSAREAARELAALNRVEKDDLASADKAAARAEAARIQLAQERLRMRQQTAQRRLAAQQAAEKATRQMAANTVQEQLPWLDDLSVPLPVNRPASTRPDGMMAVGAPKTVAEIEMPEAAAVVPKPASRVIAVYPELDEAAAANRQNFAALDEGFDAPRQGAVGTKSGPAARQGLRGSKSGPAEYGRRGPQGTQYAARDDDDIALPPPRPITRKSFKDRRPARVAKKHYKTKTYGSYKKSSRSLARRGSNAFKMQQSMGGAF